MSQAHAYSSSLCTHFTDEEHLRQGDIVYLVGENPQQAQSMLVVITADCDLRKERIKTVTVLEMLSIDAYVSEIWFAEQYDSKIKMESAKIAEKINKRRIRRDSSAVQMSVQAIVDWIGRVPVLSIIQELGLTDRGQVRELETSINAFKVFHESIYSESVEGKLSALLGIMGPRTENVKKLKANLQNVTASPPDDVFFIDRVCGNHCEGFFVRLREIRNIDKSKIALYDFERFSRIVEFRRMCRIREKFVYRMMQKFSYVFGDVALPDDHKNLSLMAGETIASSLCERIGSEV
jgi:hypothetical protein